jgi:hypothetical protein
VVTAEESVARWAKRPIALGGGSTLRPLVLGPSGVPEVIDEETARRVPELAVLSAMAHGDDLDQERDLRIAMAASAGLDADRATQYFDLVAASLGAAAREALRAMDPSKYEYQSEFARHDLAMGRAEGRAEGEAKGKAEGEAKILLKQLTVRFGPLPAEVIERIRSAAPAELELLAERVLSAASLENLFQAG